MKIEDRIEAAARAICKADMVLPDELSLASGKPRWTQYVRQAKAALKAAGIDELLEDNRKMREVIQGMEDVGIIDMYEEWGNDEVEIVIDKAKQILAQMGD